MKPPVYNENWPEDVVALYRHDLQEIWDSSISPHVWAQYQNQLDLYFSLVGQEKSLNILDVGCAQATLAILLAEKGHTVTAVDIRPQFLEYARNRVTHGDIEFLCRNVLELDLKSKYDIIFANQIVEHLVYPEQLIGRLVDHLGSSGKLIMSTPNHSYIRNRLPSYSDLGDPDDWVHMQHSADGDGHFYAYTGIELMDLFAAQRLTNINIRYFETPWVSGHMKFRYLHGIIPAKILTIMDRTMLRFEYLGKRLSHQMVVFGSV